jgi:hypothetical protein
MILRDPLIPSSQVLGRCSLSEADCPLPPLLALRGMLGQLSWPVMVCGDCVWQTRQLRR